MKSLVLAAVLGAGCQASLGPAEPDAGGGGGGAAGDAAPSDRDGDGHLDAADNCPSGANADQHDEDGDDHGDTCDPCPHVEGALDDLDGDGVGDACDPQPAVAQQRLVFFDPFVSDMAGWTHAGGFVREGDALHATGPAYTELAIANGETRIATAGAITAVATTTPHQLSLSYGFDSTGQIFHYAELYDTGGASGTIAITRANTGTYTELSSASYAGVLPVGAWSMVVDESVSAQRIVLDAEVGTLSPRLTATTATAPALAASDRLSLYIQNAEIRFDYFVVIETLPEP